MRLLEKVVLQDNLSTLVVKLYPRNEGYSLMLKDKNDAGIQEINKQYLIKQETIYGDTWW